MFIRDWRCLLIVFVQLRKKERFYQMLRLFCQIQLSLLYNLIHVKKLTMRTKLYDKFSISMQQYSSNACIWILYLRRYDVSKLLFPNMISLLEGSCLKGSYWTNGSRSHSFERFTDAITNWLTVMEYLSQMTTDMFNLS